MNNVVVTGMGIVSCIGNGLNEVLENLKIGKSGITANSIYKEMGFRSHVSGSIDINLQELNLILSFFCIKTHYTYLNNGILFIT